MECSLAATRAYHHGDLKNALLEAAEQLLEDQGLQGFTLRACARLAGVSHAAPKHHFGDVGGLLAAVAERGFVQLAERLAEHIQPVLGDLKAEMHATATAYIGFAEDYPEHFRVMFRADLIDFDMLDPPTGVVRTFAALTNVILRQRGDAEIAEDALPQTKSVELMNDIVLGWCFVHGYAHLRVEGQLVMVPDGQHAQQIALAAERLSVLIQGITDSSRSD